MGEIVESTVTTGMIPRLALLAEPVEAVEPITLQEAKDHLRVVYDDEDAYISSLIVAARQMAEGKLNRTIMQRQIQTAFSGWGDMVLRKPPIASVDSVSYIDAEGNQQEFIDYVLRRFIASPRVELLPRVSPPSLASQDEAIVVTYTAGYPTGEVPRPIVQWMLLQIGTMYQQREGVAVGVSIASVPEEITKWMLQPYMVYE